MRRAASPPPSPARAGLPVPRGSARLAAAFFRGDDATFAKAYAAKAKQFLEYYTKNPDYQWNPRIVNITCAISTKIKEKQAELAATCPQPPPAPR